MKILMFMGGGDVGGAKTHILSLAKGLAKNHTFKLISFRNGDFPNEALNAGIDVEIIPSNNIFKAKRELINICKKFAPDVIHSHGSRANLMAALIKNKFDIPFVSTVHSDYKLDYLGSPLRQYTFGAANAYALRKIDYYISVADRMRNLLITRNFDPNDIFKIYNGIDFDVEVPKVCRNEFFSDIKIEKDDVILGIAARLTEVKDIPTLLKAFEIALKKNPHLRLVIGGDGEDKDKLIKLAQDLNISDRVHFIGWVSDIASFFSSIDINIICSISETFPYAILEGILYGCATISSDVGGVNKIISSGVDGYIFKPRDFEKFAEQIVDLSSDKEKIERFRTLSFKKASANFSLENTYSTQVLIYENCIKKHKIESNKRSQITLCGAYGKGNSGDDAILRAIVSEMRQIDENIPLCVMSRSPLDTKLDYLTNSIFTFNVFKFAKAFKKSKIYINGGGSLIQDVTSSRSLYFYLFTLSLAKKFGAKVIMYGCGIGPVNGSFNRKLATKVINKNVDVITLRDEISKDELDRLGVTSPKIIISADPTLIITPQNDDEVLSVLRDANVPENKKYLGIGVRNWKNFDNICSEVAKSIDYAYKKHNLIPVFLPIEYPNDLEPSKKIASQVNSPYHIIDVKQKTETTIGLFSKMDLVLGMRLHSLIFSVSGGVPVIGMSYDIKVDGFLKYISENSCIALEEVKSDKLNELIDIGLTSEYKEKVINARKKLCEIESINIQEVTKLLED